MPQALILGIYSYYIIIVSNILTRQDFSRIFQKVMEHARTSESYYIMTELYYIMTELYYIMTESYYIMTESYV